MRLKARASFFYQLAAMLEAGLSLQHSLALAGKDCGAGVQRGLQRMGEAIAAGQDLATAMGRYPQYFDAWTVSLIRMAEYSGALGGMCRRLAIAAEQRIYRRRLYRSVAIAGVSTVGGVLLLLGLVLPGGVPWLLVGVGSLGGLAIATQGVRERQLSRLLQRFWVGVPVVGEMVQVRSLLYFTELALPLACGVPVLAAVELVGDWMPDPVLAAVLRGAARGIRAGQSLSWGVEGRLPAIAVQMVRTGEETGELAEMIGRLATYYEGELERLLGRVLAVLRPMSVVGLGLVVLVIGVRVIGGILAGLPG